MPCVAAVPARPISARAPLCLIRRRLTRGTGTSTAPRVRYVQRNRPQRSGVVFAPARRPALQGVRARVRAPRVCRLTPPPPAAVPPLSPLQQDVDQRRLAGEQCVDHCLVGGLWLHAGRHGHLLRAVVHPQRQARGAPGACARARAPPRPAAPSHLARCECSGHFGWPPVPHTQGVRARCVSRSLAAAAAALPRSRPRPSASHPAPARRSTTW